VNTIIRREREAKSRVIEKKPFINAFINAPTATCQAGGKRKAGPGGKSDGKIQPRRGGGWITDGTAHEKS
jgi:hypothetical protein